MNFDFKRRNKEENKRKMDKLTREVCLIILSRKNMGSSTKKETMIQLTPFASDRTKSYLFPEKAELQCNEWMTVFDISLSTLLRDLNHLKQSEFVDYWWRSGSHLILAHHPSNVFSDQNPRLYRISHMYLEYYDAIDAYINGNTGFISKCRAGSFSPENSEHFGKLTAAAWITVKTFPKSRRQIQRDFKTLKDAVDLLRNHYQT